MYNITIHCGADFHLAFTIREEDGALVDLTDATVDAQLREYPESKDKHDFETAVDNNRIELYMPHTETSKIGFVYGAYDVMINFPDGDREKVLWGNAEIIREVSRTEGD